MKRLLILSLLLASAAAGANSVYKWTDKNGRVHYGDRPPQLNAEKVEAKPGTEATDPVAAASTPEAKRAAECKQQKDQLAVYKSTERVVERNALGQEREYSAEEKQKLIEMTQVKVQQACAPLLKPNEAR